MTIDKIFELQRKNDEINREFKRSQQKHENMQACINLCSSIAVAQINAVTVSLMLNGIME